jgi:putative Mg2+ transporter-C (MgtC) family protein
LKYGWRAMAQLQLNFDEPNQLLIAGGVAMRLLWAAGLGGLIGLQRAYRHKASGLRTNMLLCVGSAFFTIMSIVLAGGANADKSRIASNIVQGIGFLGAGLILHNRSRILGLTSAVALFVVASIGMACGAGMYVPAAVATLIVLVALQVIGMGEVRLGWTLYPLIYEVRGPDKESLMACILRVMDSEHRRFTGAETDTIEGTVRVSFTVVALRRTHQKLERDLRAAVCSSEVKVFQDSEDE